ncbi:unnamed protein product, partial [Amoebophrya sp. A25]|eukprot:GSA25T00015500001.1
MPIPMGGLPQQTGFAYVVGYGMWPGVGQAIDAHTHLNKFHTGSPGLNVQVGAQVLSSASAGTSTDAASAGSAAQTPSPQPDSVVAAQERPSAMRDRQTAMQLQRDETMETSTANKGNGKGNQNDSSATSASPSSDGTVMNGYQHFLPVGGARTTRRSYSVGLSFVDKY